MDIFKNELARNSTGYFLVLVGLASMAYAHHVGSFDKMVECGAGLVGAALLAFQSKHAVEPVTPQIPLDPKK